MSQDRHSTKKQPQTGEGLFLRLSEYWALGHDPLQWIVLRGKRDRTRPDGMSWRGEKFIGSDKVTLLRSLKKLKATIDPAAVAALEALPDTFREWIQERGEDKC